MKIKLGFHLLDMDTLCIKMFFSIEELKIFHISGIAGNSELWPPKSGATFWQGERLSSPFLLTFREKEDRRDESLLQSPFLVQNSESTTQPKTFNLKSVTCASTKYYQMYKDKEILRQRASFTQLRKLFKKEDLKQSIGDLLTRLMETNSDGNIQNSREKVKAYWVSLLNGARSDNSF